LNKNSSLNVELFMRTVRDLIEVLRNLPPFAEVFASQEQLNIIEAGPAKRLHMVIDCSKDTVDNSGTMRLRHDLWAHKDGSKHSKNGPIGCLKCADERLQSKNR